MRITRNKANELKGLFGWAKCMRGKYPDIELLYYIQIKNDGRRNRTKAKRLKWKNVNEGVDLYLPVHRGQFCSLYIKLRCGKRKHSEKQAEWLSALRSQGYAAEICYGWRQAAELITKYLELEA